MISSLVLSQSKQCSLELKIIDKQAFYAKKEEVITMAYVAEYNEFDNWLLDTRTSFHNRIKLRLSNQSNKKCIILFAKNYLNPIEEQYDVENLKSPEFKYSYGTYLLIKDDKDSIKSGDSIYRHFDPTIVKNIESFDKEELYLLMVQPNDSIDFTLNVFLPLLNTGGSIIKETTQTYIYYLDKKENYYLNFLLRSSKKAAKFYFKKLNKILRKNEAEFYEGTLISNSIPLIYFDKNK